MEFGLIDFRFAYSDFDDCEFDFENRLLGLKSKSFVVYDECEIVFLETFTSNRHHFNLEIEKGSHLVKQF